ncbi:hypothetical protein C9411_06375 [Serratia sp. Nf2]|nr:hypothetical protein C9411_06375 [Serratia sp. Nf2]
MVNAVNSKSNFFGGFIEGAISFPVDMGYLAYDFINTDNRSINQYDTERMLRLIKAGLANQHSLAKIVKLVVDEYLKKVDVDKVKRWVEKGSGKIAGRFVSNQVLMVNVGAALSERVVIRLATGYALTSLLTLGAMNSRAIHTSRQLRQRNPEIYDNLRRAGNLDLLYFLVEPKTKPFEQAIEVWRKNRGEFDRITELFFEKVSK